MPPLSDAAALEVAALQGLGHTQAPAEAGLRPWRSPHHSASAVALVGGGSPPRPGEISLAHGGLLFLDELPEFPRSALEALREPLETGRITISRAARQATFPARFALVAAMNPCPCGWLGAFAATGRHCRCSTDAVLRYQGKLSGPLLDRMDLIVEVPAVAPDALLQAPEGPSTTEVAQVVAAAHERALARQGVPNAHLSHDGLDAHLALQPEARAYLLKAGERLGWSGRALHRVVKVARTIADLDARPDVQVAHVAEAVQLRRGLPVP